MSENKNESNTGCTYCTFDVGNLHCGIPASEIQEVIRAQSTTRVPLAPSSVKGLINLRGQIVVAIDLRECLGLPKRDSDESLMNVVIRTPDGLVSLLVDRIDDVVDVTRKQIETTPKTLSDQLQKFVTGAVQLNRNLLLIIDAKATIEAAMSQTQETILLAPVHSHE